MSDKNDKFLGPQDFAQDFQTLTMAPEKRRQLERQLAMVAALRGKQYPQASHWGGALGYGLANVLDSANAALRENKTNKDMAALDKGVADARGRYAEAAQTSDPGLYLDAAPAERARLMAEALRGKRNLGLLGKATGDDAVGAMGAGLTEDARAQEQALAAQAQRQHEQQQRKAEKAEDRAYGEAQWKERNAIVSQQQMARARVMSGIQAQQKAADAARGTVVPGMEVAPGAAPTADDAKKVKASLASRQRMDALVSELRALHGKHGTELTGPVATRMGQLVTGIKLEAKNLAELGALAGPDMAIVESLAGADPTSWGSNLKALFGVDHTATALEGIEQWSKSQADANANAYGYRTQESSGLSNAPQSLPPRQSALPNAMRAAGKQTRSAYPAPTGTPAAARRRVRDTKTGRTGWWDGQSALPPGVEVIDG